MADEAVAPAKKGSVAKWVIGGCCGCSLLAIVLFLVIGGVGFLAATKLTEPAKAEVRSFLSQTTAGDATAAYAHFADELKKVQDEGAFKQSVEQNPDLFKVGEPTFSSMSFDNGHVKLSGTVPNAKGEVRYCKFDLVQQGGTWKLLGYKIAPEPIPD